jgi:predicted enzyme related to lactoylglutathione lyase
MKKVIGLGGLFIKIKDKTASIAWYQQHLGIEMHPDWGTTFPLETEESKTQEGYEVLSFFKDDTTYLAPSEHVFMINFRVADLDALMESLKNEGIEILGSSSDDYGKFCWIMDPNGIKLELWEPPHRKE